MHETTVFFFPLLSQTRKNNRDSAERHQGAGLNTPSNRYRIDSLVKWLETVNDSKTWASVGRKAPASSVPQQSSTLTLISGMSSLALQEKRNHSFRAASRGHKCQKPRWVKRFSHWSPAAPPEFITSLQTKLTRIVRLKKRKWREKDSLAYLVNGIQGQRRFFALLNNKIDVQEAQKKYSPSRVKDLLILPRFQSVWNEE